MSMDNRKHGKFFFLYHVLMDILSIFGSDELPDHEGHGGEAGPASPPLTENLMRPSGTASKKAKDPKTVTENPVVLSPSEDSQDSTKEKKKKRRVDKVESPERRRLDDDGITLGPADVNQPTRTVFQLVETVTCEIRKTNSKTTRNLSKDSSETILTAMMDLATQHGKVLEELVMLQKEAREYPVQLAKAQKDLAEARGQLLSKPPAQYVEANRSPRTPPRSYADALLAPSSQPNEPPRPKTESLLIQGTSLEAVAPLCQSGLRVVRNRPHPQGLILEVAAEDSSKVLENFKAMNMPAERLRKRDPEIVVRIPTPLLDVADSVLLGSFNAQNRLNGEPPATAVRRTARFFTVRVSPNLYDHIMWTNQGLVYLGMESSRAFTSTRVRTCFNCLRPGHHSDRCRDPPTCAKCAGNHRTADCVSPTVACAHCKAQKLPHEGHSASSFGHCPVLSRRERIQIERTDYGNRGPRLL